MMLQELQIRARANINIWNYRKAERESYTSQIDYWSHNVKAYLIDRLGFKKEHLEWSSNPGYEKHTWDGTKDPFIITFDALQNKLWTAIESAIGTGKTYIFAGIAYWFYECFPNGRVIISAPGEKQLKLNVWREITKFYPRVNTGKMTDLRIVNQISDDDIREIVCFVAGTKANEEITDRARGFHSPNMLFICEEMNGIPKEIIAAFKSTCVASNNLIVGLGNPDHELDNLHQFSELNNVVPVQISAYDFPNIVLDNPEYIPGCQTKNGLLRYLDDYKSKEHPLYLSRARGIAPKGSAFSLIKYTDCMEAVKRHEGLQVDGVLDETKVEAYNIKYKVPNEYGLGGDVANSESGDKASIAEGRGYVCYGIEDFACPSSNQFGHKIAKLAKEKEVKKTNLKVDGIGIGAGAVNTLIDDYRYSNSDINFQGAAKPVDIHGYNETFNNLRSQAWYMTGELFRLGYPAIINDKDLIADLVTPLWTVKNGKICVESKDEIKKRLGRSPNKGDAFVYWLWNFICIPTPPNIRLIG